MKKIIFALTLLSCTFTFAQEDSSNLERKNEIHLNVFMPIVAKSFEVSYERLVNEDTGYGLYLFAGNTEYIPTGYMISPYLRKYFSKGYSSGFFMELFLSANGGKYTEWYYYGYYDEVIHEWYYVDDSETIHYNDLAFGVGAGVKFLTNDHFVGSINAGVARNLFNNDYEIEVIGRGGISIGYRF